MPTLRWFVTAAIFTLLVAIAVIAALLPIDEWNQWHFSPELGIKNYGEYGGWLQGVLTPLILLVAFIAWFSQQQSAKEANTIQARSFLLEFLHNFYGHINYTAACAIVGHRPSSDHVPFGNLQCVSALIAVLSNRTVPETLPGTNLKALSTVYEIENGDNYLLLKASLQFMDDMIRSSKMELLVDQRIRELTNLVQQH